jgi:hypothetical protein
MVRFRRSERLRAPTATRTRDLPLRRSFHGDRATVAFLVRAGLLIAWPQLSVSRFRLVWACEGHGTGRSGTADHSLVSYRHVVGHRRSPGNLASCVTRSIGECRMSLWSTLVVSPPEAESHDWLLGGSFRAGGWPTPSSQATSQVKVYPPWMMRVLSYASCLRN